MTAPPPYAGDTCRNGCAAPPLARAGRYRGQCQECKDATVEAARERLLAPPGDGITKDDTRSNRPSLVKACSALARDAAKLEKALDERKRATVKARTVLGEFKESLAIVGRVAQSLLNQSGTSPKADDGE